jgi:hypothetical protein
MGHSVFQFMRLRPQTADSARSNATQAQTQAIGMERQLRVHLINLDRSQERLAEFKELNSHLTDVERFPAVDGYSLDIPALAQQGLVSSDI